MSFTTRTWRWVAPLALVGAVGVAACGDEDATRSTRTADAGAAWGSDQHLRNQAADIAGRAEAASGSDQHLRNQAADIAGRTDAESGPNASDAEDRSLGRAQVEQYVEQLANEAEDGSHDDG